MKAARIAMPVLLAGFVLLFLGIGWLVYDYGQGVFGFPLAIGGFTIAMLLIDIAREARRPAAEGIEAKPGGAEGIAFKGTAWVQLVWMGAMVALSQALGYLLGPALVVLAYLIVDGRKWWLAAAFAGATALVVWVGFDLILQVPLPFEPWFLR